jgi:hemerythrin-like domain-containing protein
MCATTQLPLIQSLITDHAKLRASGRVIAQAADAIGSGPVERQRTLLGRTLDFLRTELIPHDRREELTVHPMLCEQLGARLASQIITRDHQELEYLTDELSLLQPVLESRELTESEQSRLRNALLSLTQLIEQHFAKEEETAFPLIAAGLERSGRQPVAPGRT